MCSYTHSNPGTSKNSRLLESDRIFKLFSYPVDGIESVTVIDTHVTNDGPFDALMGYSQGAAMVLLYLSEYASRFQFAVTFCGYLPSTHTGLNNRIAAAAPMSIPILFYMGTADAVIDNALTREAAAQFSNPTIVVDGGGHAPPQSGAAVDEIVAFVNGGYTTANEPS